jgi:hypothetical protein
VRRRWERQDLLLVTWFGADRIGRGQPGQGWYPPGQQGPNRAMIRWAGPRHARKSAVVPSTAMTSKPVTASHSGNFPAATRSPTVNMTRSAGTGIGTPASIGSSSTRASGPLRPAALPLIPAPIPAFIPASSRRAGQAPG